ncbi:hypothetical protein ES319_A05G356500v1 [Gossypium barbadense]|uniref:Uncharacterized protein n=1 Tax=Gossypium barbadense TaxID=3634 RepID=A0A5J5RSW3_GOSBA|nr:hypothetical protein ES319_D04G085500v1 [Gossypium barbadense]KAB2084772.1 hypothetical protein ES319_A05G356500v1 [Gossypium barbadense]
METKTLQLIHGLLIQSHQQLRFQVNRITPMLKKLQLTSHSVKLALDMVASVV